MRHQHNPWTRISITSLSLCFIIACGRDRVLRSASVSGLVDMEYREASRISTHLQENLPEFKLATDRLYEQAVLYIDNLRDEEKVSERTTILSNNSDALTRLIHEQGLYEHLMGVVAERDDSFDDVQSAIQERTEALNDTYEQMVKAAKALDQATQVLKAYVDAGKWTFTARSMDTKVIRGALIELEGGEDYLKKAADAGEKIEKYLPKFTKYLGSAGIGEGLAPFLDALGRKLQEFEPAEDAATGAPVEREP